MDKWEKLRMSVLELHENNSEKEDVEAVTKYILNLMDVLDGKPNTDFQIGKSQIPTVKVAYLKKSHQYHNGYECSNCGIAYPEHIKYGNVVLNYCSKCGAKFVEGQG